MYISKLWGDQGQTASIKKHIKIRCLTSSLRYAKIYVGSICWHTHIMRIFIIITIFGSCISINGWKRQLVYIYVQIAFSTCPPRVWYFCAQNPITFSPKIPNPTYHFELLRSPSFQPPSLRRHFCNSFLFRFFRIIMRMINSYKLQIYSIQIHGAQSVHVQLRPLERLHCTLITIRLQPLFLPPAIYPWECLVWYPKKGLPNHNAVYKLKLIPASRFHVSLSTRGQHTIRQSRVCTYR